MKTKNENKGMQFLGLLVIFAVIVWIILLPQMGNGSAILTWAFYLFTLALPIGFKYLQLPKFYVISLQTLPPIMVLSEICWARYYSFSNAEIFGPDPVSLTFNHFGGPGMLVFGVVLPLFVILINILFIERK